MDDNTLGKNPRSVVLAFDGGGTKLACIAADLQGNFLGLGIGGPVNRNSVEDEENIKESIASTVTKALRGQRYKVEVACIAGAVPHGLFRPFLRNLTGVKSIKRASECEIILLNLPPVKEAVLILAGTGSIATAYRNGVAVSTTGGWGDKIGDEGSAFWIGQKALMAAIKSYDGRGEKTVLQKSIPEYYGISKFRQIVPLVYKRGYGSREAIASIAPIVSKAAQNGDEVAKSILRKAAEELAIAAVAVAKKGGINPVGCICLCGGGVFRSKELILEPLQEELDKRMRGFDLRIAPFEPVTGAVVKALQAVGVVLEEQKLDELGRSINAAYNYSLSVN